jgi:hypothetical protein
MHEVLNIDKKNNQLHSLKFYGVKIQKVFGSKQGLSQPATTGVA